MADIANTPIGSTLRTIRASLDLTQQQLADRLGVSFTTVNRWEGGVTAPQRAACIAINALAAEAGIDVAEFAADDAEAAAQVTRRRSRRRPAVPTTKPMEQMLWDAACSIRGEKDAAKFKDYLLPLLFLKRLSDVFDDEIACGTRTSTRISTPTTPSTASTPPAALPPARPTGHGCSTPSPA